jgi:acetyl esterase/lipase
MRTERYGPHDGQEGDLHLPVEKRPPVVCLLHGGFWRMPHGRSQFDAVARDLARRGFAVWNLGYRRVGTPTAGWPGTFDDVTAGVEHLARFVDDGVELDLDRVAMVGHSAGGQLALWAAARQRASESAATARRITISAVAGLAPVADLVEAHALALGNGAVAALLGGTPDELPDRYQAASPLLMLPLSVPQLVIHAASDDIVPVAISRSYARAARDAGDRIEYVEPREGGHMDFLDPASVAHETLSTWLAAWSSFGDAD